MKNSTIITLIVLLLIVLGFLVYRHYFVPRIDLPSGGESQETIIMVDGKEKKITVTDGVKHTVPLDEILSGGPPKDGIPSIDDPKFASVAEVDGFLDDNRLGISIDYKGVQRFYPFQILDRHEIVNDTIKGERVLVTFCPLCGTGISFRPIVDDKEVEFGVSGKLYQSDLVMYNRSEPESLWSQLTGEAIVGEYSGQELELFPSENVLWKNWKKKYPNGEVLSPDTGIYSRSLYKRSPYGDYDTSSRVGFINPSKVDDRLHPKTLILGINAGGQAKAYVEDKVREIDVLNDELGGVSLVVFEDQETGAVNAFGREVDGQILEFEIKSGKLFDKATGSEWNFDGEAISGNMKGKKLPFVKSVSSFWFAWPLFNPETELYR